MTSSAGALTCSRTLTCWWVMSLRVADWEKMQILKMRMFSSCIPYMYASLMSNIKLFSTFYLII
jgi:hypothetical protein